jgi:hypothetical protein
VPEEKILRVVGTAVYKIHTKPFDMSKLIEDIRSCRAA